MDSHTIFAASASPRPLLPLAGYRVMARHRDQGQSLVTLAENLRQATLRARAFCDGLATGNGILAVCVEEWVGTLTEGQWKPVSLRQGGFWHWLPAQARGSRNGDDRDPTLPKTGDKVACVLLAEKTRRGGWRARLLPRQTVGPITNTADLPASAQPGQVVALRVGAVSRDGQRIQFRWQTADNAQCR